MRGPDLQSHSVHVLPPGRRTWGERPHGLGSLHTANRVHHFALRRSGSCHSARLVCPDLVPIHSPIACCSHFRWSVSSECVDSRVVLGAVSKGRSSSGRLDLSLRKLALLPRPPSKLSWLSHVPRCSRVAVPWRRHHAYENP